MHKLPLVEVKIVTDGGPWATHNYPCPVYREKHAVINLNSGVFEPSWQAQLEGWHLIKADNWFKRLVYKLVFAR